MVTLLLHKAKALNKINKMNANIYWFQLIRLMSSGVGQENNLNEQNDVILQFSTRFIAY